MKFKFACASALMSVCSLCASVSYAAAYNVKSSELNDKFGSSTKCVVNLDGGTLTMDKEFDLGTRTLVLTGVKSIVKGATFTGAKGSVLDIELTGDVSFNMTDTFLSGDLKFVKRGGKSLQLPKTSLYTGGTELRGGILNANTSGARNLGGNNIFPFGKGDIDIYAGAELQVKGYNNWNGGQINLYGGTIENTYEQANSFAPSINLYANSTFLITAAYNYRGALNLGEGAYELNFNMPSALTFRPSSISGTGKISVTGAGTFTIGNSFEMPTMSLAVATPFALGAYNLEVKDYEVSASVAPTGNGVITVNGIFKPMTENYCAVILKDGAAIDLSEKFEPWAPAGSIGFAEGATITIKVGEREFTADDYVLKWTDGMDCADRMFVISGENTSGQMLEADDVGLKIVAETDDIVYAVWTGAVDGDFTNPANWVCHNAADNVVEGEVPAVNTPVVFGDISKISFTSPLPFAVATFDDAFLGADATWNALANVPNDLVLDLKGHKLTLPKLTTTTCTATITDSVGGGVVEMEVEDGVSFNNETLNFTGKVKIVKKGLGTFVAVKDETNDGGFEVAEGKLTPHQNGRSLTVTANKVTTRFYPFGKGEITIDEGAMLDPLGGYNWSHYTINLNGGMITNTVENTGLTSTQLAASRKNPFDPTIKLLKESTFATSVHFNFQGKIYSNGFPLNLDINYDMRFLWYPDYAVDLYLRVVRGGYFQTMRDRIAPEKTAGMTLDLNAAARIRTDDGYVGGMDVENYISRYATSANEGNAPLRVHGTFEPIAASDGKYYFYGATMLDGSRIWLPESGVWEIKSSSSSASAARNTLTFEDDATITIDLSKRTPVDNRRVVGWTTATRQTNFDTLHFKVDDATFANGFTLEVREESDSTMGIYTIRRIAYDIDVKTDAEIQEMVNRFLGTNKSAVDFENAKVADVNTWLNKDAKNGYTLKDSIILGLPVVEKETCAAPYLVNDVVQSVEGENVALKFGGINPIFGKADIVYAIESATAPDAMEWNSAAKGPLTDKDMRVSVSLPQPSEGESKVKYYRVKFSVLEKASEVQ